MSRSLCVSLVLALSLSCLSCGDDVVNDFEAMNGAWLPSSAELGGQRLPDEVLKTIKLVVSDGKYSVTAGAEPDQGAVKLDPSTNPKSLDVIGAEGPNQGKTFLAIYDITGDTLKICYDLSGKSRPTEFKSAKGTQLFLVTYNRQKP